MAPRTVLVTGANGYIGNATARSFVAAGWLVYGLVRSPSAAVSLALEEIIPVIGSIDDVSSHAHILQALPSAGVDTIVSTTEDMANYAAHFANIVALCKIVAGANAKGRPLVIFTSGCKDYGMGPHDANDPDVKPDTEESPIQPPAFALERATTAPHVFRHADAFPAVLTRPTNVYGRSSSFWRVLFEAGAHAASAQAGLRPEERVFRVYGPVRPSGILHALHVDDCGDAYVAIATHHLDRASLAGEVFNVSARRYETVDQYVRALAAEYGLAGGVEYVAAYRPEDLAPPEKLLMLGLGNLQWVGSDKLRRVTGWDDRRPLFTEGVHAYRAAFEAAERAGSDMVRQNANRTKAIGEWLLSTLQ